MLQFRWDDSQNFTFDSATVTPLAEAPSPVFWALCAGHRQGNLGRGRGFPIFGCGFGSWVQGMRACLEVHG